MKDFNFIRFIIGVVVMYILGALMDMLVHNVILGSTYASLKDIWREDMMDKMWIMYVLGLFFWIVFVYLYHFFYKGHYKTGWMKGGCYGLIIGLFSAIGMSYSYVMYPLPLSLAIKWAIFAVIQLIICGIVLSFIYKPKDLKE